jgi:hypothetical protein
VLLAPGQVKNKFFVSLTVAVPLASTGRKNPFPSILPSRIRSSGCSFVSCPFIWILQPAIDHILRYFHVASKMCKTFIWKHVKKTIIIIIHLFTCLTTARYGQLQPSNKTTVQVNINFNNNNNNSNNSILYFNNNNNSILYFNNNNNINNNSILYFNNNNNNNYKQLINLRNLFKVKQSK